jgi:hypothetical protein
MNSINHHDHVIELFENSVAEKALNKTASAFEFKKIMYMNNALFTDMLMLCNRRDATSQKL